MDDDLNRTTFLDAERELDVSVMMGAQSVIVVATLVLLVVLVLLFHFYLVDLEDLVDLEVL